MARSSRHQWLQRSAARPRHAARGLAATPSAGRTLRVESLEDRRLLANVTVGTLSDVVNGDVSSISALVASDGGDGISLREAILAANANASADTIDFAASLTSGGPAVIQLTNVGHVGEIVISRNVTINGPGAALLTIQAFDPTPAMNNGDGNRVFKIDDGILNTHRSVALSQLTLTGGDVSGSGGAILSEENLTIAGCTISGNSAGSDGGGVYGGVSTYVGITITDSNISGNSAGRDGGGIRSNGNLDLADSSIANNTANSGGGVAGGGTIVRSNITGNIAVQYGGGLNFYGDVSDSTIRSNQANYGGGLASGKTITNTVIQYNTATSDGGGAWNNLGALVNCTISENTAGRDGGGVWGNSGNAGLDGCTLATNAAGRNGGGMFVVGGPSGIVNTTISGNVATNGGGIFLFGFSQFELRHSTVVGNRARIELPPAFGPGIFFAGGLLKLDHSIVSNVLTFFGESVEARYSIVSINAGSPLVEAPLGTPDANGNLIGGPIHGDIDPLVAPLGDNGGVRSTHALLPTSPALNAGNPAAAPGVDGVPVIDGRSTLFARIAGGRIDIGAYERQSLPAGTLTVDTLVDEDDGHYGPGDLSLREAIDLAVGSVGPDTITFAPALTASGPATINLADGGRGLSITTSLSIVGPGAHLLTIDASASSTDSGGVFNIRGPGPEADIAVTMSGLTITGGHGLDGRGITASYCNLTVSQSRITGNTLYFNYGSASSGGGIRFDNGLLKIYDSSITNNSAHYGGGVFAGTPGGNTSLEIHNSVISNNYSYSAGGGIRAFNPNPWIITGSTVSDNQSNNAGGSGIMTDSDLTVRSSTISGNGRGGISGGTLSTPTITVIDSTISDNRRHGGIHTGGAVNVTRSTIAGNLTMDGAGGGIRASQIILNHSIVANNAQDDVFGNGTAVFSLIGNKGSAAIADGGGSLIGTSATPINPLLGPLADNGGPTLPDGSRMLTHTLLPGSPAIDAGNPGATPGAGGVPQFDQRGAPFTRVHGGRIDMGAFELQPNADFNANSLIEGFDFLAWQRGFGAVSPGGTHAAGDADYDQDVDAGDLALWTASFGNPAVEAAGSTAVALTENVGAQSLSPNAVDAALAYLQLGEPPTLRPLFRPRLLRAR